MIKGFSLCGLQWKRFLNFVLGVQRVREKSPPNITISSCSVRSMTPPNTIFAGRGVRSMTVPNIRILGFGVCLQILNIRILSHGVRSMTVANMIIASSGVCTQDRSSHNIRKSRCLLWDWHYNLKSRFLLQDCSTFTRYPFRYLRMLSLKVSLSFVGYYSLISRGDT